MRVSEPDSGTETEVASSVEVNDLLVFVRSNESRVQKLLQRGATNFKDLPKRRGTKNFVQHAEKHPDAFEGLFSEMGLPPFHKTLLRVITEIFYHFSHMATKDGNETKLMFEAVSTYILNDWLNEQGIMDKFLLA